ncbi:hypothetical protein [Mammaliicoccus sciuri]|uniref:hypothetical protein n=1 Tax=Mammaliicoccus sciuri TaxID=1296 RepID=UPI0027378857|nr:hypothetical protein [Mammaliicoccus sciuri]
MEFKEDVYVVYNCDFDFVISEDGFNEFLYTFIKEEYEQKKEHYDNSEIMEYCYEFFMELSPYYFQSLNSHVTSNMIKEVVKIFNDFYSDDIREDSNKIIQFKKIKLYDSNYKEIKNAIKKLGFYNFKELSVRLAGLDICNP